MPSTASNPSPAPPPWMTLVLRAAAVYNVLWGLLTLAYPNWLFDLTGLAPPTYPFIWQCVGMIVGVYGVGYWIAAADPARHWPIVLVGLLGKIFGPLGYVSGLIAGGLGLTFIPPVPAEFGVTLPTNDLIWWVPFGMILFHAAREASGRGGAEPIARERAFEEATASNGRTVAEMSHESPVLLVMVRHSGCTFCKEALADLGKARQEVERFGVRIVIGHMSTPEAMQTLLERYGLGSLPHVSDPTRRLYASLHLWRGSAAQLFGPDVWLRGLGATLRGHLVGKLEGDGFQLGGAVLIKAGGVEAIFKHSSAADRTDYMRLACKVLT